MINDNVYSWLSSIIQPENPKEWQRLIYIHKGIAYATDSKVGAVAHMELPDGAYSSEWVPVEDFCTHWRDTMVRTLAPALAPDLSPVLATPSDPYDAGLGEPSVSYAENTSLWPHRQALMCSNGEAHVINFRKGTAVYFNSFGNALMRAVAI